MNTISRLKENLFAITACFLWATAFPAIKIGLEYMPPLLFAGIRFMLVGIMLLPFCGNIKTYFDKVRKNIKLLLLLAFFQTFLLYSLFFIGMTYLSGSLSAIIIGSAPLFTAVISHILIKDDRLNIKKVFIILLGIAGIVIISITRAPISVSGSNEILGIFILLCAVCAGAVGNVIVSRNKSKMDALTLNSSQIFSGGLMIFVLSIPVERLKITNLEFNFFPALLWLCMISAVSFSLWFYLLQHENVKVSELNIWKFIIPVLGAVLSWLIIPDEKLDIFIVTGMLIVSSSILLFNLINKKQ